MFGLATISDVIKICPQDFDVDYKSMLIEEIDRKYSNKVVADVGLCITVYDFLKIESGMIHQSDGSSHTHVTFRMVSFRPFINEVIVGKIASCNAEGVFVSTEFSHDIFIPSHALQSPSIYDDAKERLWVWQYGEENDKQQFFMEIGEEIRVRVTHVKYVRVTDSAKGSQATTTEAVEKVSKKGAESDRKRRSSSVDLTQSDPRPSALQVLGSINEDGLGLTAWWA